MQHCLESVNWSYKPPFPLEFPGSLTSPPPLRNFQFPPWWGYGYFLEPHIDLWRGLSVKCTDLVLWQNIFEHLQHIRSRHVGGRKSWKWVLSRLSDNNRASAGTFDLCFNEIGLCFEKLICVLLNWIVFWNIVFCFEKLLCVSVDWFVF